MVRPGTVGRGVALPGPGAVYISNWAPLTAVKRFIFREPGTKPKPED